jgi:hypothetical protein
MAVQIARDASPQTCPIGVLLGPEIESAGTPKHAWDEPSTRRAGCR